MFKFMFVMAALGACVYFGVCGSSSHEAVMEDTLGIYDDVADILSKITDEKSAVLARPKLEALKVEIDDLERSAESLEPATPQEQQELHRKFAPKLQVVMTKLFGEMMRLAEMPEVNRQLAAALPLMNVPSFTPSNLNAPRSSTNSTRKAGMNTTRRVRTSSRRVPS